MPDEYLSTDPNAGDEYLSTDPNAGEEAPKARDPKTVMGLLANALREVKSAPGAIAEMVSGAASAVPVLNAALQGRPEATEQVGRVLRALPGAVVDDVKTKYGSLEKAGNTAYDSPLSTMMDASVVLPGAGAALKATKVPGLVKAGQMATTAGRAVDPVLGAARGVAKMGQMVRPSTATLQRAGTRMMQSAMKVPALIDESNIDNVAETAARLKIMPTAEGFQKNAAVLDRLRADARRIADEAAKQGRTIDPEKIVARLNAEIGGLQGSNPLPSDYQKAVARVRDEFWQGHSTPPNTLLLQATPGSPRQPTPITPRQSMSYTETLNKQLPHNKRDPLGMRGAPTPTEDAKQALNQAIKAERDEVVPGFADIQKERGQRLGVQRQLRNYTLRREGNANVLPPRVLFGAGLGAGMAAQGQPIGGILGGTVLPYVMDSAAFKGRQAIRLYHGDTILDKAGQSLRSGARATTLAETGDDLVRQAIMDAMENSTEQP